MLPNPLNTVHTYMQNPKMNSTTSQQEVDTPPGQMLRRVVGRLVSKAHAAKLTWLAPYYAEPGRLESQALRS
jgi:hypothetical protein